MLALLVENMGTIIVSIILIFIVAAIIRTLRKKGTSCSCGCSGCPSAGMCHKKK